MQFVVYLSLFSYNELHLRESIDFLRSMGFVGPLYQSLRLRLRHTANCMNREITCGKIDRHRIESLFLKCPNVLRPVPFLCFRSSHCNSCSSYMFSDCARIILLKGCNCVSTRHIVRVLSLRLMHSAGCSKTLSPLYDSWN